MLGINSLFVVLFCLAWPLPCASEHWIVELDAKITSHEDFHRDIHAWNDNQFGLAYSSDLRITHEYRHLSHGLAVAGSGLRKDHVLLMQGVLQVTPVARRRLGQSALSFPRPHTPELSTAVHRLLNSENVPVPWGLDVLDGAGERDNSYTPAYTGRGVDVYILDTGLDTTHREFSPVATSPSHSPGVSHKRVVKNLYDAFAKVPTSPAANTDDQGHGTHCAGVIGGNRVGVAAEVNILGVKVLDQDGEGDDATILHGLDFVASRVKNPALASSLGSVVTMSLGGPCATNDCSQDVLNKFVEHLALMGVVVSVASGNEGCNACYGSPNGAASAYVVGALTKDISQAFFSNFGQCIDVFAPGEGVLSACSGLVCDDEASYLEMTGTSMAAPHVTGVLAQLRQKHGSVASGASLALIYDSLVCDAVPDVVTMLPSDTITRNLLLQTPGAITSAANSQLGDYCHIGSGCPDACSGRGVCLFGQTAEAHLEASRSCFCDPDYWGANCGSDHNTNCDNPHYALQMRLSDTYGDGWSFAKYSIVDTTSQQISDHAYDSLCDGTRDQQNFCLLPGCYELHVSRGDAPAENSWSLCDINGGSPAMVEFCVDERRNCRAACSDGRLLELHLADKAGDGWQTSYYAVYAPDGSQLAGGILAEEQGAADLHTLCVKDVPVSATATAATTATAAALHLESPCVVVMFERSGVFSSEDSVTACGVTVGAAQILEVCPSSASSEAAAECSAALLPRPSEPAACPPGKMAVPLAYVGIGATGPAHLHVGDVGDYVLGAHDDSTAGGGGSRNRLAREQLLCVPDGCHKFSITNTTSTAASWAACGYKGSVPWGEELCVEAAEGLCYGLSGCAQLKSYVHHSSLQYYFLSQAAEGGFGMQYQDFSNIHGVHGLCGVTDQTSYSFDVGFGRHNNAPPTGSTAGEAAGTHDKWYLCGQEGTFPARGTMEFSDGGRSCTITSLSQEICPVTAKGGEVSLLLAKLDTGSNGWGSARSPGTYVIRTSGDAKGPGGDAGTGLEVRTGTLGAGSYGVDALCLLPGQCYTISLTGSVSANEMFVLMCGELVPGTLPAAAKHLRFCVRSVGACVFDDDAKAGLADDDFLSGSSDESRGAGSFPSELTPNPSAATTAAPSDNDKGKGNGTNSTSDAAAALLGKIPILRLDYDCRVTVFTESPRALSDADLGCISFAVQRVLVESAVFPVWDVGVSHVTAEQPPQPSRPNPVARTDRLTRERRRLYRQIKLFETPVSFTLSVAIRLTGASAAEISSAAVALDYMITAAANPANGRLQQTVDLSLKAMSELAGNDDDRAARWVANTPTGASIVSLSPASRQGGESAGSAGVEYYLPTDAPDDGAYEAVWNEEILMTTRSESTVKFPLGTMLLLTSLCTTMVLLALYSHYLRYYPGAVFPGGRKKPKKSKRREVGGGGGGGGGGGASSDYHALSVLSGSEHSLASLAADSDADTDADEGGAIGEGSSSSPIGSGSSSYTNPMHRRNEVELTAMAGYMQHAASELDEEEEEV